MTDLATPPAHNARADRSMARPAGPATPTPSLTRQQKAAIIIGILGAEAAGPLLEQLNEDALRNFAAAMSRLRNVPPETVARVIHEFLNELPRMEMTIGGGLGHARTLIQDYVNEATLSRIMDDAEAPSVQNIWKKVSSVDDGALLDFLSREHPQTTALVLSKLSAEKAGMLLGQMAPDLAREVSLGLMKAASLDPGVVEAIGLALGKDILAKRRTGGANFKPADRIGAIMNFTSGEIRQSVLAYLDDVEPELAAEVKRKMFTFQDIPKYVEKRDIAGIVRATDGQTLIKALAGAADNAPETQEFMLSSISSRMAEQLRGEIAEAGKIKTREAEEAQNVVLKVIREQVSAGTLTLVPQDD